MLVFPKLLSVHSSLTALASHHHNPTSVTSDPPPLSPKVQTGSTGSNGFHAHPCVPSLPKTQPGIFESQSHLLETLKTWILSSLLLTKHGSRGKNCASPLELSAVLPSFTFPALMPQVRSSWSHVSLCISQPPGPNSQGITNFTWGSASKYKKRTIVLLWIDLSNVSSCALKIYIKAALWKGTLDQEQTGKKKIQVIAFNFF